MDSWATDRERAERIGAFAGGVIERLYTVVYGEPPVGVRTWCDGGALLMLLRLRGRAPFGSEQPEQPGALPYDAIPELVVAAVREQADCELTFGDWSVEPELGLVLFVFRLPLEPPDDRLLRPSLTALSELVPADWLDDHPLQWLEVGGAPRISPHAPALGHEHLRLVGDDRPRRS